MLATEGNMKSVSCLDGDFVCDKRLNDGTCADKCPFVNSKNCEAEFKAWLKEEAEGQH